MVIGKADDQCQDYALDKFSRRSNFPRDRQRPGDGQRESCLP
jgi:hypothetical protein